MRRITWLLLSLLLALVAFTPAALAREGGFSFASAEDQQEASPSEEGGFFVFSDVETTPQDTPITAVEQPQAEAVELPILVNGDYSLPSDYVPEDLVLLREYCDASVLHVKGSEIEGHRVAVDALMAMFRAAIAEGIGNWQISSGYRSIAYQQRMWDDRVYSYRKEGKTGSQARAAAARYMALPGASEHHTGLAFDVTVPGEESFVSTKQYRWMAENCWDYGFIIRYTDEKKEITGINAEPWHIRYVGLPHSLIMKETGMCLEEYIAAQ